VLARGIAEDLQTAADQFAAIPARPAPARGRFGTYQSHDVDDREIRRFLPELKRRLAACAR